MQNRYQNIVSFFATLNNSSERSEESGFINGCNQILRNAQDDTLIGNFYFDTASFLLFPLFRRLLLLLQGFLSIVSWPIGWYLYGIACYSSILLLMSL